MSVCENIGSAETMFGKNIKISLLGCYESSLSLVFFVIETPINGKMKTFSFWRLQFFFFLVLKMYLIGKSTKTQEVSHLSLGSPLNAAPTYM